MNKTGEFIRQIGEILNSKSGEILFRKSGEQICDDSTKRESAEHYGEFAVRERLENKCGDDKDPDYDYDHGDGDDAGAVFKTD